MRTTNKMSKKTVFIYNLNFIIFVRIIFCREKTHRLLYVNTTLNAMIMKLISRRMDVSQIRLSHLSTSFHEFQKNLYNYTEKIFKHPRLTYELHSILKEIDINTDKLIVSLKKHTIELIAEDYELFQLYIDNCKKNRKGTIFVKEFGMMKGITDTEAKFKRLIDIKYYVKNILLFIYTVMQIMKKLALTNLFHENVDSGKINFIIEQNYKGNEGNPEFEVFHRYFKQRSDVLNVCIGIDSEIYRTLKSECKPVIIKDNINFNINERGKIFFTFMRLLIKIVFASNIKSIRFKNAFLQIFFYSLYYETLFKLYRPAYYLKVRSDYQWFHPVITAIADKYNVKHIGYMHGSYGYFMAILAHINFHYYGLLGKRFKEIFAGIWPDEIRYIHLGPHCAEARNDPYSNKRNGNLIIGFIPRQVNEINKLNYSYSNTVGIIWKCLYHLNIPNIHLIFKEISHEQRIEEIKKNLHAKFPLSYETFYSIASKPERQCYIGEILSVSDIVVIASPGYGGTGFEAIGKKKKLLILLSRDIPPHPFESYNLPLVVKNEEEFIKSFRWLMEIPQKEYELAIQPIIEDWSKTADGNLVKNFVETIERDKINSQSGF